MRLAYAKALRELQPHAASTGELSFIFSAKSFSEAYSRIRYLRRFSAWRERRAENIRRGIDRIAAQRARLTSLRHSQDLAYRKAEETQTTLSRQQAESEKNGHIPAQRRLSPARHAQRAETQIGRSRP